MFDADIAGSPGAARRLRFLVKSPLPNVNTYLAVNQFPSNGSEIPCEMTFVRIQR
jgi:hypothetical protein